MKINEPYAKERDCPNCGKVVAHCNAWICGKCGAYFKDRRPRPKKYSVAELEKIWQESETDIITGLQFLELLKDKKKVQEILK